jgi:hypothetical protein
MSNYIIKTNKKGIGEYEHQFCDENGKAISPDTILENGSTVKDILFYHTLRTVPFMRQIKVDSLESKMEIV